MRVLIIDDDPVLRVLLGRQFLELGWTSTQVSNHNLAISELQPGRFDLALVDVNLGIDDGINLAILLRDIDPKLRLIIMSGEPSNDFRAQSAGFSDMLTKPFTLEDLRRRL